MHESSNKQQLDRADATPACALSRMASETADDPLLEVGQFFCRVVPALRAATLALNDAQRLADAIDRHLADPRRVSLDEAFGVKTTCGRHWSKVDATHNRAFLLAEYRARYGVSVATLAREIDEYYRRHWPADQKRGGVPAADRNRPRELLFLAFKEGAKIRISGGEMPRSTKQLRRILDLAASRLGGHLPPLDVSLANQLSQDAKSKSG